MGVLELVRKKRAQTAQFDIFGSLSAAKSTLPALKVVTTSRPLVIGHRGFCRIAPENTLLSFRLAIRAKADLIELDYHHSKDDKLIVIHDSTLDRTTDAVERWKERRIKVEAKTAAKIRALDAGSWFDSKFAGAKVPQLSEALQIIQKRSVALIERKAGDAAACIRLLKAKRWVNRAIIQSFDWHYLRQFHDQLSHQVLGALGPPTHDANGVEIHGRSRQQKALGARWLDELGETGARIAVWNRQVSAEAIALAHDRGLKVWIYTIDDPALANHLLDLGVDGLITNNPALIRRTIRLRSPRQHSVVTT